MSHYRSIWEQHNNQKIPKGYHIHHRDKNHANNDINNLQCITAEEHWLIHYNDGDPIGINGKFIQGASEAGRIGGKLGKPSWTEEMRIKVSDGLRRYYANNSSVHKGTTRSDEFKKKVSESLMGEKNPRFGVKHTPESIEKIKNNTPKMCGELNGMYGKKHTNEAKKTMVEKKQSKWKIHHSNGNEEVVENLQFFMQNNRSDASCIKYWSQRNPIKDGIVKCHPKYKIYVEKVC